MRHWPSNPPEVPPMGPSKVLSGLAFTGRHARYTSADTWYPSWASDDKMYSPWTDGSVGPWSSDSHGRLAMTGRARIIGSDPLSLVVEPLGTLMADPSPYEHRYPGGSLVYEGIWYYSTYCLDEPGGQNILGPLVGFHISTDAGATWKEPPTVPAEPLFGESAKYGGVVRFGAPHFVDFGKNMEHSPDGYAYLVGHGTTRPLRRRTWISGDAVFIARVRPDPELVNLASSWEFFIGFDEDASPRWGVDVQAAQPIVRWDGHAGNVAVTWFPGLRRFIMSITDGGAAVGPVSSYILEASCLEGPWHMVTYLRHFGTQGYFLNFPSRFISSDSSVAWLCYSANCANRYDGADLAEDPPGSCYAMCLQEVHLLKPEV